VISTPTEGASAHAADAAVNKAMAATGTRRRPSRSLAAAAVSRNAATVSV
jgi:uncharacterized protein GlcG (DUF336 family)